MLNYCTVALISHTSKVMLKILQARLQKYVNRELPDVQAGFRKGRRVQFSLVTQSCPTLCNPMNCSTPGLPVHHQLLEFTQTRVHRVSDAIQPSHPLSSPSPPALNLSQHQFSSVAQSCPTLCDPMNCSTPGLPVHHQLPEFTQTRVHRVSDTIQPSHPLSSPSPPAPNPSQHQSLFQ